MTADDDVGAVVHINVLSNEGFSPVIAARLVYEADVPFAVLPDGRCPAFPNRFALSKERLVLDHTPPRGHPPIYRYRGVVTTPDLQSPSKPWDVYGF